MRFDDGDGAVKTVSFASSSPTAHRKWHCLTVTTIISSGNKMLKQKGALVFVLLCHLTTRFPACSAKTGRTSTGILPKKTATTPLTGWQLATATIGLRILPHKFSKKSTDRARSMV